MKQAHSKSLRPVQQVTSAVLNALRGEELYNVDLGDDPIACHINATHENVVFVFNVVKDLVRDIEVANATIKDKDELLEDYGNNIVDTNKEYNAAIESKEGLLVELNEANAKVENLTELLRISNDDTTMYRDSAASLRRCNAQLQEDYDDACKRVSEYSIKLTSVFRSLKSIIHLAAIKVSGRKFLYSIFGKQDYNKILAILRTKDEFMANYIAELLDIPDELAQTFISDMPDEDRACIPERLYGRKTKSS